MAFPIGRRPVSHVSPRATVRVKLDEALRLLSPDRAEHIIAAIDKEYAGRHTDPGADKRFS